MRTLLSLALLVFCQPLLFAADWPQFLGPNRDNSTTETIKPWVGDLKPVWKKPLGPAHSSPVVVTGVIYAFYQPGKEAADALAAYDAKTGERLWEKKIEREAFSPPFGPGPRGTPAVVDGGVYTLGGTGILAKWDAKTGDVKWKVDTLKQFDVENLVFGVSGSPLVTTKHVIVNVGGKDSGVVAFDRDTGATAWKATSDGASYSSPILAKFPAGDQVVVLTKQFLRAFDPATGKEIWKHPFQDRMSESATTPLQIGDSIVGSSVTLGSVLLKAGAETPKTVWMKKNLNCYFSTPVLVGEHLYMFNGVLSITPSINLRCVELSTGKILWEKADVGKYHAALIRTKDNKLLMFDDGGSLELLEPNPKAFKSLAKSKVCGPTWAHPAFSDGMLIIRDDKEMLGYKLP